MQHQILSRTYCDFRPVLFSVQKPCSNTCKQASFIVVQRGPYFPPKAKVDITRMGKGEKRKKNPDLLCQKSHYLSKTLKKNALYYSPFEHNCVRQTQNEVRLVLIHLTSTGLQSMYKRWQSQFKILYSTFEAQQHFLQNIISLS